MFLRMHLFFQMIDSVREFFDFLFSINHNIVKIDHRLLKMAEQRIQIRCSLFEP